MFFRSKLLCVQQRDILNTKLRVKVASKAGDDCKYTRMFYLNRFKQFFSISKSSDFKNHNVLFDFIDQILYEMD